MVSVVILLMLAICLAINSSLSMVNNISYYTEDVLSNIH